MASGPTTSWQIGEETMETVRDFIFLGSKISPDADCSYETKRRVLLGRKAMTNLDSILKSRDITNKGPSSQSYGFPSSHVWMWELDHRESWVPKNWWFWTVVLEKTLESPLDCKEIQPVHPKGYHWIFIGRTDAEAETPVLWPSKVLFKEPTLWKRPWCWERLQAGGEGDDREWDGWMASLLWWTWICLDSKSWWWTGRPGVLQSMGAELDTTERLNWTEGECMLSFLWYCQAISSNGATVYAPGASEYCCTSLPTVGAVCLFNVSGSRVCKLHTYLYICSTSIKSLF